MNENKYLTVTALNRYIAYKIDSDVALRTIYIKGEISNARISKGHLYFVLKDEESEISALIFYNVVSKLTFTPKDGMKVLIIGTIQSYSKKGNYNLIVSKIEEYGQGLIYQKFIELKNKLDKAGLFASEHKKNIPEYPVNIGVITSDTGDAVKDIISTIQKRYPIATIYLYKALVQGEDAPKSLIKSLKKANNDNIVDVIIIGRGGGSIEDLNCFNDEELAYEIYNSHIPIVSGVGHENDYTICDFVADDRAPTPTGAAVRVTKDKMIIFENLSSINRHINNLYANSLLNFTTIYNQKINMLNYYSPLNHINNMITEVNNLEKRLAIYDFIGRINKNIIDINNNVVNLNNIFYQIIKDYESRFIHIVDKLILVNPLNIMKKGYSLVYKDNQLVTSSNLIAKGDIIDIHFHDGNNQAKIIK